MRTAILSDVHGNAIALRAVVEELDEERIERLINGIVREIEITGETEISARTLGALVMKRLAELDQVAYVRFASVYRQFRDVGQFKHEVDELQRAREPKELKDVKELKESKG